MPMLNSEIVGILNHIGDVLAVEGANPFRIQAYYRAARTVAGLPRSVAAMVAEGADLDELPGIGEDLAGKIEEIVRTGRLAMLDELERQVPAGLSDLLDVEGLGPRRVRVLHEALGVDDLATLGAAAAAGKIRKLKGFGARIEAKILEAVKAHGAAPKRLKLIEAEEIAAPLLAHLRSVPGIGQVVVAGSYRRRRETVGDLDILVTCGSGCPVVERFVDYEDVTKVLAHGRTRSTVILRNGLQVDMRVVPERSYGAALHYFTGSKAHNIALRKRGMERGLRLNEYGVFRGRRRLSGRKEEDVFAAVGLPFIAPELREDGGEIDAAASGRLPRLVEPGDIRGDLHVHSRASDGRMTLKQIAAAAHARGYEYVAVTDHSQRLAMAHGLDKRRLAAQVAAIDRLNERLEGITLLKSTEVDILEDGRLDLPDSILKRLDLVVGAVHSHFDLARDRQTERIIRAMDNACFTILAHPTGRLINERQPYDVDLEHLLLAARERGCFVEANAQPDRLDLNDVRLRMAKELGVKVAVSTDTHRAGDLGLIRFGIDQARRGWLEAGDVLNTRRLPALRKMLRRQ